MNGRIRSRIKSPPAGAFSAPSNLALLEVFEETGEPPDTTEVVLGYAVLDLNTGEFRTKLVTEALAGAELARLEEADRP